MEDKTLDVSFTENDLKLQLGSMLITMWQQAKKVQAQHEYLEELEAKLKKLEAKTDA